MWMGDKISIFQKIIIIVALGQRRNWNRNWKKWMWCGFLWWTS